ncbi:MAG: hypothetical protein SAK29_37785 [Scytonema sp. PMC 1069.18]|nr:hypothetical protein [Scytonema sp. PMC 1069.18]MEC4885014.1 hypothetical protein [Scytonema sp. PMC 1070.18]
MAILQLEDGTRHTDLEDIVRELAVLDVRLNRWVVGDNEQLRQLLKQDSLSEDEKEQVLKSVKLGHLN